MLYFLIDTETEYAKCFSKYFEDDKIVRFRDNHICDMYSHNYTLVKGVMCTQKINNLIIQEIIYSKKGAENFLQIGCNFSIKSELLKNSYNFGAEIAYVLTDSSDTAKDMYRKCGFAKIGTKTILNFTLQ